MKFRTKILLVNLILIAAAFAISGTLLLNRSYQARLNREITGAMDENQMIQASVEAEVINRILRDEFTGGADQWRTVGQTVKDTLQGTGAWFQILDQNKQLLYEGELQALLEEDSGWLNQVSENLTEGKKQYVIYPEGDSRIVAAAGMMVLDEKQYYVVNRKDITEIFSERDQQVKYYQVMTLTALTVCGLLIYLISGWLMRPIVRLSAKAEDIAEGNYGSRVRVRTEDEIGRLGRDFNRMADTVQEHVQELEDENRRKEDFVANFTHELKTPLTSVIGYAEMLSSQNLSEEERAIAANYIFKEGLRLEAMSMKLFDLILLDREGLELKAVYMPDLMDSIRESVEPLITGDEKQLVVRPVPAYIRGDATLLKTVFINMLDNARKASPKGGKIVFVGMAAEEEVTLQVVDFGIGIPPEEASRITEAFYMVDKSRSRDAGGAGLGLSLAAKILEKHGAKLTIESEVGKGTVMNVCFRREADIYEE